MIRSRKPLIAITAGRRLESTRSGEMQSAATACPLHYVNAIVRAGGAPLLIPCMADAEAVAAVVSAADGLLLTGGGDISALAYGEEPHPASRSQDPVRDAMETEATQRALEKGIPVLGICRGIQMLNVALGGTLIQDIPTEVKGACLHAAAPLAPSLIHTVEAEAGSLFARVLGDTAFAVNSYHHQAVKTLGRGLKATGRAKDGVVEAVEANDGRPILAVQFHPEELAGQESRFQALFDWLVQAAG
jgi:putative glutamine amidotransferase